MTRKIVLQTSNSQKLAEYKKILGRHGLVVEEGSKNDNPGMVLDEASKITAHQLIAVMREESNIYDSDGEIITRPEDLQIAINRTDLDVYSLNSKGELETRKYQATVEGYIDETRRNIADIEVFGWDAAFVHAGTGMSYHDMRKIDAKLSGRDLVLGEFVKETAAFPERKDLKFNPRKQKDTIDFTDSVIDFAKDNPYWNNSAIERYGIKNLLHASINQGLVFRAAKNRRENIYWLPSLNAGLPLTPKSDAVHEITFMTHDVFHFLIPDLLFDGSNDEVSRRVYIIYRMMSEAFTLALADMLFVDTLKRSGIEYDFEKRKIYPLFASLKLDFEKDPQALKKLLHANVKYCLLGDDSEYKELGCDQGALDSFKGKYNAYFVEDYRWTEKNFENMSKDKKRISEWRDSTKSLTEVASPHMAGVMTVSDFIGQAQQGRAEELDTLPINELVEVVFENIFKNNIARHLEKPLEEFDPQKANRSAFLKYMLGQLYIFDSYQFIPESKRYRDLIINYLKANIDNLSLANIKVVRAFYNQFVEILYQRKLISVDDLEIYREIFPLFPPFFINYDRGAGAYEDVGVVGQRILSNENIERK